MAKCNTKQKPTTTNLFDEYLYIWNWQTNQLKEKKINI